MTQNTDEIVPNQLRSRSTTTIASENDLRSKQTVEFQPNVPIANSPLFEPNSKTTATSSVPSTSRHPDRSPTTNDNNGETFRASKSVNSSICEEVSVQNQDPETSHRSEDTSDMFGCRQDSLDPIKSLLNSTSTFATLETAQRPTELSSNSEPCAPSHKQRNTTN